MKMQTILTSLGRPTTRHRIYVVLLIVAAAVLRLWGLEQMEFKGDEAESLNLGIRLLRSRPWVTDAPWPEVGLVSSGGIMNPPLYNSFAALMWLIAGSPVGCVAIVALANVLCLPALYLWARQFLSQRRALVVLGWMALSPFAVIHSRKLWPPEMLLPGLVLLLWGVRYWQKGTYWLGAGLLFWSVLFISQLHLSGPVYLVAIVLVIAVDMIVRAKRGILPPLLRPRFWEPLVLLTGLGVLAFYTVPYLRYLDSLYPRDFEGATRTLWPEPRWLYRVGAVVVPLELEDHFNEHWARFLAFPSALSPTSLVRWLAWVGAIYTAIPLALRGAVGWLRRPNAIAILGSAWIVFIVLFALLRLPAFGQYPLMLMPLPALLVAGAFEPEMATASSERRWAVLRWVHLGLLGLLTCTTLSWVVARGGSLTTAPEGKTCDPYGIGYGVRLKQARAIISLLRNEPRAMRPKVSFTSVTHECHEPNDEVLWLVKWLAPELRRTAPTIRICEGWPDDEVRDLPYRWMLEE